MSASRIVPPLLLLAACGDVLLDQTNESPAVVIQRPGEGATFGAGEPIELLGRIRDDGAVSSIEASWLDNGSTALAEGLVPDADGFVSFTTADLGVGSHAITLRAVDPGNLSGEATVTLVVVEVAEDPRIDVLRPGDGDRAEQGQELLLEAQVEDPQDAPEDLHVEVASDLDGFLCTLPVASDGAAVCRAALHTVGDHRLAFTVTDTDGNEVTRRVVLPVDPVRQEPTVRVLAPSPGEVIRQHADQLLRAEVGDRQDAPTLLQVTVASDLEGELCAMTVDADGLGACLVSLSTLGRHRLTFTATDTDDHQATADVQIRVSDGTDVDDDGDGYTEAQGDCDDDDPRVYPGAPEVPDGLDNDCDGTIDEGTTAYDDDGDGYCEGPSCTDGSLPGDCNDASAAVNPGMPEVCNNGVDDNCSGVQDEPGAQGCIPYWTDADGDGFGNPELPGCACTVPANGVLNQADCDDTAFAVHPNAPEVADGIDNDCDGLRDEGTPLYDDDGDGYCEAVTCTRQADGTQPLGGDCDDARAAVNPGATEICTNGIDDDCDGLKNEGEDAIGCTEFWRDLDNDGFGAGESRCYCPESTERGDYRATNGDDCYDHNPAAHPGQAGWFTAHRGDGSFDYDCDGAPSPRWPGEYACACTVYIDFGGFVVPIEIDPFEPGWVDEPACGGGGTWVASCEYPLADADFLNVCVPLAPEIRTTDPSRSVQSCR